MQQKYSSLYNGMCKKSASTTCTSVEIKLRTAFESPATVISAETCPRLDGFAIIVNEKISLTSRKCLPLNYRLMSPWKFSKYHRLHVGCCGHCELQLKYLFRFLAIVLIYSVWRIPRGRSACHFRATLRQKKSERERRNVFLSLPCLPQLFARYFFNFVVEITAKINDDKWKSAKLVREKNYFHYGRKETSLSSRL